MRIPLGILPTSVSSDFHPIRAFFEVWGSSFSRCLEPTLACTEPGIRAHSVQNARYLELLQEDGHLFEVATRANEGAPIQFRRVGRHQATTFAGLCARHDSSIFRAIDIDPVDFSNPEHLFLLAYRAVYRETHATAEAGLRSQNLYLRFAAAGKAPRDRPSEIGMAATVRLALAYETYLYKQRFDALFDSQDWTGVAHDVIRLPGYRPSVAAACLFSLDDHWAGADVARACLTILPLSPTESVAVFSYDSNEADIARVALEPVLCDRRNQAYRISRRLLNSCENFVLAPAFLRTWDPERERFVLDYFTRTLMEDDLATDDDRLMLFWPDA